MKQRKRKIIIRIIETVLVLILMISSVYCIGYVMSKLVDTVTAISFIKW